jgi:hypothetical protein
MSPADFWNLAGRAGRWGKEFQGNIVCVDVSQANLWPDPPKLRVTQPLTRATDRVLTEMSGLRAYIAAGAPVEEARRQPLYESAYSLFAAELASGLSIDALPGTDRVNLDELRALETEIRTVLSSIDVPTGVLQRHAGISPPAMQRLLVHFRESDSYEAFLVTTPESNDAATTYVGALGRSARYLGADFGVEKRQWQIAYLIQGWMRGFPLAQLIASRLRFRGNPNDEREIASVIRETMADVEQVARFEAPKYLACYLDVLAFNLHERGREDVAATMPDLNMMLELGVSRATEVSLMALGLSRTSVIAISQFIIEDELTREEALTWLRAQELEVLDIPALVREEIDRIRRES